MPTKPNQKTSLWKKGPKEWLLQTGLSEASSSPSPPPIYTEFGVPLTWSYFGTTGDRNLLYTQPEMRAKAVSSWALLAQTATTNVCIHRSPTWLPMLQPFLLGPLQSHFHHILKMLFTVHKQINKQRKHETKSTTISSPPPPKHEEFDLLPVHLGRLFFFFSSLGFFFFFFSSPWGKQKQVCC